jgi:hypothetical protein
MNRVKSFFEYHHWLMLLYMGRKDFEKGRMDKYLYILYKWCILRKMVTLKNKR